MLYRGQGHIWNSPWGCAHLAQAQGRTTSDKFPRENKDAFITPGKTSPIHYSLRDTP